MCVCVAVNGTKTAQALAPNNRVPSRKGCGGRKVGAERSKETGWKKEEHEGKVNTKSLLNKLQCMESIWILIQANCLTDKKV